jgi:ABC-2 type transport system permease protein
MAAGLCFAVMLLNYFVAGLAAFIPSTAVASLICFAVVAVLLGVIVYVMTKNSTAAMLVGMVLAAVAGGVYLWKPDGFVGAFPKLLNKLSLFEQFYTMLEGVFDLRSILYLLSVCAVFLFLSVQSMEKRRWSE